MYRILIRPFMGRWGIGLEKSAKIESPYSRDCRWIWGTVRLNIWGSHRLSAGQSACCTWWASLPKPLRWKQPLAIGGRRKNICSNTATKTDVDMVCLGCPHCSLEELIEIGRQVEGKKISQNVRLWVATGETNYGLAKNMGVIDVIESAGGFVNSNICVGTGMLLRFAGSLGVEVVANNGLTLSGLVSQGTRGNVGVCFGNIEKCINAALTGKWEN